jgi:hypothetical protein
VLYLIGTQIVVLSNRIFQIDTAPIELTQSRIRRAFARRVHLYRDDEVLVLMRRIDRYVRSLEARLPSDTDLSDLDIRAERVAPDDDFSSITTEVISESKGDSLDPRILITAEVVHAEVSRLRAEAELRSAFALPGGLLAIAVAVDADASVVLELFWLVGVAAFLGLLVVNAVRLRTTARRIVLRLIADGTISTPTLDRLREATNLPLDES